MQVDFSCTRGNNSLNAKKSEAIFFYPQKSINGEKSCVYIYEFSPDNW